MRNYITNYDPFFDRFFLRANNCSTSHMMKTDIKENKSDYQLFIELPEVKKEDTRITLENGYLTISASKKESVEGNKHNYLRRERNCSLSRSYYVGDVKEEEVKAKYENGVLTVEIPKEQPKVPTSHQISID